MHMSSNRPSRSAKPAASTAKPVASPLPRSLAGDRGETPGTALRASTSDPWHYPRPELAKRYLDMFAMGLTASRALFARRRMGKSEFLKKDLIPAALEAGYRTAYLNLWEAKNAPTAALVAVLGEAMRPRGFDKVWAKLNAPLKAVKVTGQVTGLAEAGIEASLSNEAKAAAPPMLRELLATWDQAKQPLLLCLDEAQVLAEAQHADLAHALRAGLDVRKDTIKVIFAGSSEPTLRRMFAKHSEPFYHWSPMEPFELLGEDFVRAMVATVNERTRYPLAFEDALAAFDELQRTPLFFRDFLNAYLVDAPEGWKAALESTRAHALSDADYALTWNALLAADRSVLRLLADGFEALQSDASRQRMSDQIGVPVTAATVQHAVQRLVQNGLLVKVGYGRYNFADTSFADWVLERPLDD